MELGEKLLRARLEAGLTQRQLCGEQITRNMLSRIEHGAAKPSMKTLQYLASQLGKPMSYFLEEAVLSPGGQLVSRARCAFEAGNWALVLQILEQYTQPDPNADAEAGVLGFLAGLHLAEQAAGEGRWPVAEKLLAQARQFHSPYITEPLRLQASLLAMQLGQQEEQLPSPDGLLLRYGAVELKRGHYPQAQAYLEAVQCRQAEYYLLRGELALKTGDYPQAEHCLLRVESPRALPLLEECYRAQGDYESAYRIALRRRREGDRG